MKEEQPKKSSYNKEYYQNNRRKALAWQEKYRRRKALERFLQKEKEKGI